MYACLHNLPVSWLRWNKKALHDSFPVWILCVWKRIPQSNGESNPILQLCLLSRYLRVQTLSHIHTHMRHTVITMASSVFCAGYLVWFSLISFSVCTLQAEASQMSRRRHRFTAHVHWGYKVQRKGGSCSGLSELTLIELFSLNSTVS